MIHICKYPPVKKWATLTERAKQNNRALRKTCSKILRKVKKKGDKALLKYTSAFDGADLTQLVVSKEEIDKAASLVPADLRLAIMHARENITAFHKEQSRHETRITIDEGIDCWRISSPIDRTGFYIPGGNAPLFSTILMLAIPAQIAGCRNIIMCTPPGKSGDIHPAILFTASLCGIENIYKTGGAQAIAAMAYGTETIPRVDKIFGPGNSYVTTAKQLVQMEGIAIDMPAGPSELMIVSDESGNAAFVAADLLSQLEHGEDSQVILATSSEHFADQVVAELTIQSAGLPRLSTIRKSMKNSRIIIFDDLNTCMEFASLYAPEHLILAGNSAEQLLGLVTSAGSVFLGNYSPESAGDYASGTNHTLPTNGYARAYSGVSADSFIKKITVQQLSSRGLQTIANTVMTMADAEGLQAHKNAISIRLK